MSSALVRGLILSDYPSMVLKSKDDIAGLIRAAQEGVQETISDEDRHAILVGVKA